MNKTEETETRRTNDYEEDNWDDWGDAESEITDCDKQSSIASVDTKKTNQEKIPSEKLSCSVEAKNSGVKNHHQAGAAEERPEQKSWGSVLGGVVSSVLSTASGGLGSITSTVTNAIGVPDPEEMARLNVAEQGKDETLEKSGQMSNEISDQIKIEKVATQDGELASAPAFGLNIVSGVTTLGSKVINTGLDTLEGIGKKTMNILQENDPLLLNKRKILGLEAEKPNLSEVLKEAKQESDQLESTMKELKLEKSKEQLRFDILFENNGGLVHLEALEILSIETDLRIKSLREAVGGRALVEFNETINEVKELMEFDDLEGESDGNYDENQLNDNLMAAVQELGIQVKFDDLKKNWAEALICINNIDCKGDMQETYSKSVSTLAETCALEVNKLHKIAEVLLVKQDHSTAHEVESLAQLCREFTLHLSGVANRFAASLNTKEEDAKPLINALFGEMCNAMEVIEKALKLFLPILQYGAI